MGISTHDQFIISATMIGGAISIYTVPTMPGSTIDGLGYNEGEAGLLGTLEIAGVSISSIFTSGKAAS